MAQFRDIDQQKCLTVVDKHLEALCRAIGYDGEFQELATELCSRLYWYRDHNDGGNDVTGLSVYVWLKDVKVKAAIVAELKAAEEDWHFRNKDWYLGGDNLPELCLALEKKEIGDFATHLDRLLKWTIAAVNSRPKIRKVVRTWAKSH